MSDYELCTVLLKWLQTFQLDGPHKTLDDLTDGVSMAQALHQIAPEYFSTTWLSKMKTDVGDNWRLKVSNLKKLIAGLADYYQEYFTQPLGEAIKPDAMKIGEHKDTMELAKLLQLILGCAVNCNKKQDYIQRIMMLEESVQSVIMQSIQELENSLGSAPLSFTFGLNEAMDSQIDHLVMELQSTVESRDRIAQKCFELDMQVSALQDERNVLLEEKRVLEEKLRDTAHENPMKENVIRKQTELLKEEMFKLETSRDDYQLKYALLEKEFAELQGKFDSLQQTAAEARNLKDEVDILREDADKVEKLESAIDSYKKKLEELGELKRETKALENKNLAYMQQTMELEEELKRASIWKTQVEVYKKQIFELRANFNEEAKKADKMEFENAKLMEKLAAVEKEKERLVLERDALKEKNDELLCSGLQLKQEEEDAAGGRQKKCNTLPEGAMSANELKRQIVALRHENALLKINEKKPESDQLQVLQMTLDDAQQMNKQLQIDCRRANQRILSLESELNEFDRAMDNDAVATDLRRQLEKEKNSRLEEVAEKDREMLEFKQVMLESLATKERELEIMQETFQRNIKYAQSIAKRLDFDSATEVVLEEMEKQSKEAKCLRDVEEKLMASAFYNLALKKQHESMDHRLLSANAALSHMTFLSKQRQSSGNSKMGFNVSK